MSNRVKGIIAIIASAFGFALMAMCVRLTDDYGNYIPCFEKSFFRNFVALIIAAVAFARTGSSRGRSEYEGDSSRGRSEYEGDSSRGRSEYEGDSSRGLSEYGHLFSSTSLALAVRCLLGTIGIFANFYALSHIPIAEGQTLNKTAPFFTLLFTWLFLGEKVSVRQFTAVVVAFFGAALVVKPGFAGSAAFPLAMGLLGGICAGGAYAVVRYLGKNKVNPSLIVLVFSAFSCLTSIPLTLINYVNLTYIQLVILFCAGVGAAIGQFGITLAYRYAAPREISVFDYTNIVFTAIFGYLVFGQISDAISCFGIVVIIAAAIMLFVQQDEHTSMTHRDMR